MFKPTLTPARAQAGLVAAAAVFEVPLRALTGPRGTPRVFRARQVAMAALYEACEVSYSELGRLFDRDHTTVIHGVARAQALAAQDADYAAALQLIAQEVRAA